jgi:Tfp pilus assembly protein PilF
MLYTLQERRKYTFTFIALFILLVIIYGNSFRGEWHFDDTDNIVHNDNAHLKSLSWPDIKQTFYFQGHFSRPVSRLSFGLNYYIGGLDVFGYHLINLIIHYVTAIFLFLFIYNTLKSPILKQRFERNSYPIALLSTLLWAINPVQVLAVSYIVQRMASMAGMFYIMAMYFYLKARTAHQSKSLFLFSLLTLLSTLLAIGSKQNAAMIPFSLFIYDIILIQGASMENILKNMKVMILLVVIIVVLTNLFINVSSILGGYDTRTVSLSERLLTEPRVVVFYIFLLIYPIGSHLTLLHDIQLSSSLLHPWTTLPAILTVLCFITYAISSARKRPLLSFCIIFFFLNHIIESSFIPLEIMYEHRNYIPSFTFFIPLAIFIMHVLAYFSRKKVVLWLTAFLIVFIFMAEGHTVFMRNEVLRSELTLWFDNVRKSPNVSLAHNNLGKAYQEYGLGPIAIREIYTASKLNNYQSEKTAALVEYNIGQFWLNKGRDDQALIHFRKSLTICPGFADPLAGLAIITLKAGQINEAYRLIKMAEQSRRYESAETHEYLSIILFRSERIPEAMKEAQKALEIEPERTISLIVLAECHRTLGENGRALQYW